MMRSAPEARPSFGNKIKNIGRNNFRGLVGFFVPFVALIWQGEKGNHPKTIQCMWLFLTWSLIWQPVHLPVCGIIPVFILPMAGVLQSSSVCACYMNESVVVFLLGTMINMLLNNSGFDRRMELSLLQSGNNSAYNPRKLVFKSATAAYVLSIFSSRQIVTNDLITFLAPTLLELKGSPDTDFDRLRGIVCNAIHTAATIGCNVFPHGSMTILNMRSLFYASPKEGYEYPDVFNYMQYIIFAFPVTLVMFILSTVYYMVLVGGKTLSPTSLAQIGGALKKHKAALPKKMTLHEMETLFFLIVFLILCLTRWCKFMNMGWASFAISDEFPVIPRIRDAVCCAICAILLFSLPKGFGFFKYLTAKKVKDLPPAKAESGILFWRFVDKNVLYGYIFLFGAGAAVSTACMIETPGYGSLGDHLTKNLGKTVTDQPWPVSTFIICFMAVLLANIMPGIAACTVWCPFIVNMSRDGAPNDWDTKMYLGCLAVGFGTSCGFMWPFLHTPAYFTHYVGKTPKKQMAKNAIGAVIICFIVLWLAITFIAPKLWDPNDGGFVSIKGPDFKADTTTAAGAGPAPDPNL